MAYSNVSDDSGLKSLGPLYTSSDESLEKLDVPPLANILNTTPNTSYARSPNYEEEHNTYETHEISTGRNTFKEISKDNAGILSSEKFYPRGTSLEDDELNTNTNTTNNVSVLVSKESTSEGTFFEEDKLNSNTSSTNSSSILSSKESALEGTSFEENKSNTNTSSTNSSPILSFEKLFSQNTCFEDDELNTDTSSTNNASILGSEESTSEGTSFEEDKLNTNTSSTNNVLILGSEESTSESTSFEEDELNTDTSSTNNASILGSEESISEITSFEENKLNTNTSSTNNVSILGSEESTSESTSFEEDELNTNTSSASSSNNTIILKEKIIEKVESYLPSTKLISQNILKKSRKRSSELKNENLISLRKGENSCYPSKSKFSITTMKREIISEIDKNRLIFIKGPNGCGKSTEVPLIIYDSCLEKNIHCNIIVTQPTRISATSIAKWVSHKRSCLLGTFIGYQTNFIEQTCENTFITYCTNDVLLRNCVERNMKKYTHIILDEVHERSKELDILLYLIKTYLTDNLLTVKIILMSATFNLSKFANYFLYNDKDISLSIVDFSEQNSFHRNIHYLYELFMLGPLPKVSRNVPVITKRMMIYCVKLIKAIEDFQLKIVNREKRNNREEKYNKKSAFLIFLPKIQEIKQMYEILMSDKYKKYEWEVIIFDSSMNIFKQGEILKPRLFYNNRRIILATNIAENGIIIPNVKYVIDFCLTVESTIDEKTKFAQLKNVWASKIICEQRSNRLDCEEKGYVYRLVSKKFYETVLTEEPNPEIMTCPLEDLFLQMKIYHTNEPDHIFSKLLDPPSPDNIKLSRLLLQEYGALRNTDKNNPNITQLSDLGYLMTALPLEIYLTKLIVLGYLYGVIEDAIIIACCISVKDIFFIPYKKDHALKVYSEKLNWADDSGSDCITLLNVYKEWINMQGRSIEFQNKWAIKNFLQLDALHEISIRVNYVKHKLEKFAIGEMINADTIKWNDKREKEFILKIVIAGTFYPHYYNTFKNIENPVCEECLMKDYNETDTVVLNNFPVSQPVYLYTHQLKDIFKRYLNSYLKEIIVNSFYSQVHIKFNEEKEKTIPLMVYKSIQMRKLEIPLEIYFLNERYSCNIVQECNSEDPLNRYYDMCDLSEDKRAYMNPILPGITISTFPLKIINFINPYHFWIYIPNTKTEIKMIMIYKVLNKNSKTLTTFNSLPEINDLVAVLCNLYGRDFTSEYYRGIVKRYIELCDEIYVTLLLIDIGYTITVHINQIREIKNEYIYKIPALAIECVLAKVQANPMSDKKLSIRSFLQSFIIVRLNQILYGKIYSIVDNVIALTLMCQNKEETININTMLINKNFAIAKEESQLSNDNNYVRSKWLKMSRATIESFNKMQYHEKYKINDSSDRFVIEKSDCVSRITLGGPYSLLEYNFLALTKVTKSNKIIVDCNSINSVVLDNNFRNNKKNDLFLVAGKIMQNAISNTSILCNTTLIEGKLGLKALIVLIFSSHLELRRNLSGTYYIGALCGLGFDKHAKCNIFPEHDMEIHFDVEISSKDIELINELRKNMNLMVHYLKNMERRKSIANSINRQRVIKNLILKLLQKRRKRIRNVCLPNFDKWGIYQESEIIEPDNKFRTSFDNYIYEAHSILTLN